MSLQERLAHDLKIAQKAGEGERVSLIRMLIAHVHNREIEKRGEGKAGLDDAEVIEVLKKEAKKRKEAIELFRRGGRDDLAEKEEKELELLSVYVPKEMGREEIARVIDGLIQGGLKDFNSLMKEAMRSLKGKADGKTVSEMIKERLQ